jgi:dTDP-glucose pyrophosphorylase
MGSRYGGLKQLDPVGPRGEILLDYSIYDAIRAGFDRVVFVIRREFASEFNTVIGSRYADALQVETVFQSLDSHLPDGCRVADRTKPWGTGHAVLCAKEAVDGPFAVVNADDLYGRESFARLAGFFKSIPEPPGRAKFAMVGFQLARTLSENGSVSRGVCVVGAGDQLEDVVECTGIRCDDVGPRRSFSGLETVSMNFWGLTPAVFGGIERRFAEFLSADHARNGSEFYLPVAISSMIKAGEAEVFVLPSEAEWFGITYREDKSRVTDAIKEMTATGEYPTPLDLREAIAAGRRAR